MKTVICFLLLMLLTSTAEAYIGPGLGMGTIGVVLGILAAIILTLIAIVWYPVKRLIKPFLKKKKQEQTEEVISTVTDSETKEPS